MLVGLVAGLASVYACSSGGSGGGKVTGTGGGSGGLAGSTAGDAAGAAGQSTAGASGAGGDGGLAGSTAGDMAGAAGQSTAGASGTGGGGSGGLAGAPDGGAAGVAGQSVAGDGGLSSDGGDGSVSLDPITIVLPTAGCGTEPGAVDRDPRQIHDSDEGHQGPGLRRFEVRRLVVHARVLRPAADGLRQHQGLPAGFRGPGLRWQRQQPLRPPRPRQHRDPCRPVAAADSRSGTRPIPARAASTTPRATTPSNGPSTRTSTTSSPRQLCFDRNRVFAAGTSSGAWFANELGLQVRRRSGPSGSRRPRRTAEACSTSRCTCPPAPPTRWRACGCTKSVTRPVRSPGNRRHHARHGREWLHDRNGLRPTPSSTTSRLAAPTRTPPARRSGAARTLYPLVVCPLPGNSTAGNEAVVNPGWSTFIKLFSAPPLLTQ